MGNNNAKPLESPLPPQSPQTQAAEATPPSPEAPQPSQEALEKLLIQKSQIRQQLLQCFSMLSVS
jgi:hypothetical protein